MGLRIILRQDTATSYFKRYLLKLIAHPDLCELVICSGYFQEDMWGYSVLDDDLLDVVRNHPQRTNIELKIVGGKFSSSSGKPDQWEVAFHKFVNKVRRAGITYQAFLAQKKNWHAKIIIAKGKKQVLGGIIGSSNLTRPAFAEGVSSFNYECDVVMFPDTQLSKLGFDSDDLLPDASVFSPIVAQLSQGTDQPDEITRLSALSDEVMDDDDLAPFEPDERYQ